MAAQRIEFMTPLARLVQGSPFVLNDKDRKGVPYRTVDGKPKQVCFFAVAIAKNNPEWDAYYGLLYNTARQLMPQFFDPQTGACNHPSFSWKISDGDGRDQDGKNNAEKPGWAGHWVVRFSGSFLPRCFEQGRFDESQRITDPARIKLGYYVRVAGSINANTSSQKPGLYLNSDLLALVHLGEEITGGRSASDAFGAMPQSQYVPPGAIPLGQSVPMGAMQQPPLQPPLQPPQQGAYVPPQQGAYVPPQQGFQPQFQAPPQQQPQFQPPAQQGFQAPPPQGAYVPPQQGFQPPQQGAYVPPGGAAVPGSSVQPNAGFVAGAMQQAGVQQPQFQAPQQQPQFQAPAQQQAQPQLVPTELCGGQPLSYFYAQGATNEQLLAQGFARWQ